MPAVWLTRSDTLRWSGNDVCVPAARLTRSNPRLQLIRALPGAPRGGPGLPWLCRGGQSRGRQRYAIAADAPVHTVGVRPSTPLVAEQASVGRSQLLSDSCTSRGQRRSLSAGVSAHEARSAWPGGECGTGLGGRSRPWAIAAVLYERGWRAPGTVLLCVGGAVTTELGVGGDTGPPRPCDGVPHGARRAWDFSFIEGSFV